MMVLLQDVWFRVLLFLVVAPLILLHSSCWLLVLRLYRAMRVSNNKPTSSPLEPRPSTMYTPEPHAWDQPLPIWAITPPQNAWDPTYLQQFDPRYSRERSRSRSRRSSSHSRSQSQPSTGYRHSDSISLSDKYGERRAGYEEQSDSRYETEDQSEYRTDEDEAGGGRHLPQTDLEEEETEIGESEAEERGIQRRPGGGIQKPKHPTTQVQVRSLLHAGHHPSLIECLIAKMAATPFRPTSLRKPSLPTPHTLPLPELPYTIHITSSLS